MDMASSKVTLDILNEFDISPADLERMDAKQLQELAELTLAWASSEDTKFNYYKPAPIARHFHASTAKVRATFGGNRSSKTYSHIVDYAAQFVGKAPRELEGIIPAYRLDPRRRLRFCYDDYPNSFMKVIWPYIQQLVPDNYIKEVIKDSGRIKAIVNEKGGFIEFMSYDQERRKFQGSSRHSIGYDEEPPQDIRDENLMRLVDTDGDETFSLTPVSGAVKYLYDYIYLARGRETEYDYELIFNEHGKLMDASRGVFKDNIIVGGNPNIHVFFSCIFDNPAISKEAAIRILSTFSEEEVQVRSRGHFLFLGGLVYKEYNDATHLVDPFDSWYRPDTRYNWTLYVAIDPHPRVPHAVTFMVVDRSRLMYIVDELFMDCNAQELVNAIIGKCRGVVPERIIVDASAWELDPSSKSCLAIDMIECGLDNPFPEKAPRTKEYGIISARNKLSLKDVRGRLMPELFIAKNCENTRREITHYAWDNWSKNTSQTKGEKQRPVDKDDHFMENMYRLVVIEPNFIPYRHERSDYKRPVREEGRSPVTGY